MGRLQKEIRQERAFSSLEEEVYLNLQRTADALLREAEALLRPFGLSPVQYNALRILRGSGASGRTCGEIAERLISRDPDITRLLDRLEARGWVHRARDVRDRRIVTARMTPAGAKLLARLDGPVRRMPKALLGHVGRSRLRMLNETLERARSGGIRQKAKVKSKKL